MKLKRTREEALNLESLEGFPMQLDASFYWSKSDVSGIALVKDEYASRKLKAVEVFLSLEWFCWLFQRSERPRYICR